MAGSGYGSGLLGRGFRKKQDVNTLWRHYGTIRDAEVKAAADNEAREEAAQKSAAGTLVGAATPVAYNMYKDGDLNLRGLGLMPEDRTVLTPDEYASQSKAFEGLGADSAEAKAFYKNNTTQRPGDQFGDWVSDKIYGQPKPLADSTTMDAMTAPRSNPAVEAGTGFKARVNPDQVYVNEAGNPIDPNVTNATLGDAPTTYGMEKIVPKEPKGIKAGYDDLPYDPKTGKLAGGEVVDTATIDTAGPAKSVSFENANLDGPAVGSEASRVAESKAAGFGEAALQNKGAELVGKETVGGVAQQPTIEAATQAAQKATETAVTKATEETAKIAAKEAAKEATKGAASGLASAGAGVVGSMAGRYIGEAVGGETGGKVGSVAGSVLAGAAMGGPVGAGIALGVAGIMELF
jgi:hypothetical protein